MTTLSHDQKLYILQRSDGRFGCIRNCYRHFGPDTLHFLTDGTTWPDKADKKWDISCYTRLPND